ncbi:MAG: CPBP family intramembrane metalloprotease [Chloroflexi bacterium]|nr:CPBP family intramembrane metalloprotease [Chloroflexota bacterium]
MGLIESLLVVGLLGLLVLLRLDAQRFGVAEYDDSGRSVGWRPWVRRLGWFGLATAIILLIYWLYPQPVTVLHLDMGTERERSVLLGLALGLVGIVLAILYAWIRYAGFRFPAPRAYPGAIVNSIGTAFVDEAVFRGVMLGLLLEFLVSRGVGIWPAILLQAAVYGIATRLLTRGRSKGMLFIDLVLAVAGGWLVVETGAIGAAVLGHAITRFAVFLLTGHSDQSRPVGWEPEDVEGRAQPPEGWEVAGRPGRNRPIVGVPPGYDPGMPPSGVMYAGESPFAGQGYRPPHDEWQGPPGSGPWQSGPWDVPPGMTGAPPMGPTPGDPSGYAPDPSSYAPDPSGYAPDPSTYAPDHAGDPSRYAPQPAAHAPDSQDPSAYAPPPGAGPDPGTGPWPGSGPWVADPATGAWAPAQGDAPPSGDADGGPYGHPGQPA